MFCDLHENNFKQVFKDTLHSHFSFSIKAETTRHYNESRATLMKDLIPFSKVSEKKLISLVLLDDDKLDDRKNKKKSKINQIFH